MKLVGKQQLNAAPGDYGLYAEVFGRLPKELRHRGDVLRYVGYEGHQGHGNSARFLGAVVDSFEHILPGMVGWELSDGRWTIWHAGPSGPLIEWQEDIRWQWREGRDGEVIGEFRAVGPKEWAGSGTPREVLLICQTYAPADGSSPPDDVELVDHDAAWPKAYRDMEAWLLKELGPAVALRLEHYGSTAIPGMPAKPVVDILVEIPSFAEGRRRAIPILSGREWEYWWYSGHLVFIKRRRFAGERTHHVHMAPRDHAVWDGLAFRDYLRTHPADARRYADLKRQLASEHQRDREAYTEAKTAFVAQIAALATAGWRKATSR